MEMMNLMGGEEEESDQDDQSCVAEEYGCNMEMFWMWEDL